MYNVSNIRRVRALFLIRRSYSLSHGLTPPYGRYGYEKTPHIIFAVNVGKRKTPYYVAYTKEGAKDASNVPRSKPNSTQQIGCDASSPHWLIDAVNRNPAYFLSVAESTQMKKGAWTAKTTAFVKSEIARINKVIPKPFANQPELDWRPKVTIPEDYYT